MDRKTRSKRRNATKMMKRLVSFSLVVFLVIQAFSIVLAENTDPGVVTVDPVIEEVVEPAATPGTEETPAATPEPEGTPSAAPTATPAATPEPAGTPTATPEPTGTPSATPTATPTQTPTQTPEPTADQPQAVGVMGVLGGAVPLAGDDANITFSAVLNDPPALDTDGTYHIETGKVFSLDLTYTVGPTGIENGSYRNPIIYINLPMDSPIQLVDGAPTGDMQDIKHLYYPNIGVNRIVVQFASSTILTTGGTYTGSVSLRFANHTTLPDEVFTIQPDMSVQLHNGTTNTTDTKTLLGYDPANPIKMKSVVSDEWEVAKTAGTPVIVGDFYEVEYTLDATLKSTLDGSLKSADSFGRLELNTFSLADAFDVSDFLPNGEAQFVSLQYAGNGATVPAANYTLDQTGGYLNGITITNPERTTDASNLDAPAGTSMSSRYLLKVKFPVEAYELPSNTDPADIESLRQDIDNEAVLNYTLLDGTGTPTQDDATIALGDPAGAGDAKPLTVAKHLKVGTDAEVLLNTTKQAEGYPAPRFSLWTNAACTIPARQVNGAVLPSNDLTPGADGTVTFANLRPQTYYLKETVGTAGAYTHDTQIIKVTLKDDGTLVLDEVVQGTAANISLIDSDGKLKIINVAKNLGILQFTKLGRGAGETAYSPVGGSGMNVQFELRQGGNTKATAWSAADGVVRFQAVPAGSYELWETNMQADAANEYGFTSAFKVADVTVTGGVINSPDLITAQQQTDAGVSSRNVVLNESVKGKFRIKKVDDNNAALTGAVFDVYGPYTTKAAADAAALLSDSAIAPNLAFTMDMTNTATMESRALTVNTWYVVREKTAPFVNSVQYSTDPAQKNTVVTIASGGINEYTIKNYKMSQIRFRKYLLPGGGDVTNKYPVGVAGIAFEIYKESPTGSGNYVLVTDGQQTTLDGAGAAHTDYAWLLPGTYYYKEIDNQPAAGKLPVQIPAGFKGSFTVAYGDAAKTISVVNDTDGNVGQIVIIKKDKVTGSPMNGVTFNIRTGSNTGPIVDTITTGAVNNAGDTAVNGVARSKYLAYGTYYYDEVISATSNYSKTPVKGSVTLGTGVNAYKEIVVENVPLVNIRINKTDSVLNTNIASNQFSFQLKDLTDTTVAARTVSTNAQGVLYIKGLEPGHQYQLIETAVNGNYVLNATPITFTAPGVAELTTQNTGDNFGTLTSLTKIDNVRKAIIKLQKNVKAGTWTSTDTAAPSLANAKFGLYTAAPSQGAMTDDQYTTWLNNNAVATATTDASGVATFSPGVEPGKDYWVVEITAPANYQLNRTPVKINAADVLAGANVTGYNRAKTHATMDNTPTAGDFIIKKVDGANSAPLEGAVFSYVNKNDATINGTLTVTPANGLTKSRLLPAGTYVVTEVTVPDGYVKQTPARTFEVTVTAGGTNVYYRDTEPVENEKQGNLLIPKKAAFTISGGGEYIYSQLAAKFKIFRDTGAAAATDEATADTNDTGKANVYRASVTTSLTNGTVTVTGLDPGNYWVKETEEPDGFPATGNAGRYFRVTVVSGQTVTVTDGTHTGADAGIYNTPDDGLIRITKKDLASPNPQLEGATFQVYVKDDTAAGTLLTIPGAPNVKLRAVGGVVTAGQALSSLLEPGNDYYVYEVTPPTGYNKLPDPADHWQGPLVIAEGVIHDLIFYNYDDEVDPWDYKVYEGTASVGATIGLFRTQAAAEAALARIQAQVLAQGDAYYATLVADLTTQSLSPLQTAVTALPSGQYTFTNLAPGTSYYVMELIPAQYNNGSGNVYYLRDNSILKWDVSADAGGDGNYIENNPGQINNVKGGSFMIHKVVDVGGLLQDLGGVEFAVYPAVVNGSAPTGFVVDPAYVDGNTYKAPLFTFTTNSDGTYASPQLASGHYMIIETGAPAGIVQPDPKPFAVDATQQWHKFVDISEGKVNQLYYGKGYTGAGQQDGDISDYIYNKSSYGRFLLRKQDGLSTTTSLAAGFTIYTIAGAADPSNPAAYTVVHGTFTTTAGADYYMSDRLPAGWYMVKETTPATNYGTDGTAVTGIIFEIKAGQLTIGGTSKPAAAGATHILDAATNFNLTTMDPIIVNNYKTGGLTLTKYGQWMSDTTTRTPIQGVVFEVYPGSLTKPTEAQLKDTAWRAANRVGTGTTNASGVLTINGLNAGSSGKTYWLAEVSVPAASHYAIDWSKWPVSVNVPANGGTATVTVDAAGVALNPSTYGRVEIEKVDKANYATKLSDVEFAIYKAINSPQNGWQPTGIVLDTLKTDGIGRDMSIELAAGDYVLVETVRKPGYYMDSTPIHFTITEGGLTQLVGDPATSGKAITNEKEHKLEITKKGNDGLTTDLLGGTTFAIYDTDPSGTTNPTAKATLTTSTLSDATKGKLTFDDLKPNTVYWVRETSATNGYALAGAPETLVGADAAVILGSVQDTNGNVYYSFRTSTDTPDLLKMEFINDKQGGLVLDKMVAWIIDESTSVNIPLEGARFELRSTVTGGPTYTATTNASGRATFNNVDAGTYDLYEVYSPAGNLTGDTKINTTPITIVVGQTNNYYTGTTDANGYFTGGNAIANTAAKGRFELEYGPVGTDFDNDPTPTRLDNGEFDLYRLVNGQWEQILTGDDAHVVTDGTEAYISGYLDVGEYLLIQDKAPGGWRIIEKGREDNGGTNQLRFTITAGGIAEARAYSDRTGRIEVTKKSDVQNGNVVLLGATFDLYKIPAANTVKDPSNPTNVRIGQLKDIVTGSDTGVYYLEDLIPGFYYVLETAAPPNYALNTTPSDTITINEGTVGNTQQTATVEMLNSSIKGRIVIEKISTDLSALDGAVFDIYSVNAQGLKDQKVQSDLVTGTDGAGRAVSDLLDTDGTTKYIVVETRAGNGHILDPLVTQTEYPVTVKAIQKDTLTDVTKVTITNVPQANAGDNMATGITKRWADNTTSKTAPQSLLEDGYSFTDTFRLRGFANGSNTVPYDEFIVTDEDFAYYGVDASGNSVTIPADQFDHVINSVTVYTAQNTGTASASTPVNARIEYKTTVAGNWQVAGTVSNIHTKASESVTVGNGAIAVRVIYQTAGAGFTSGGIDINVTIKNRLATSVATRAEVRRVTNQAKLDYTYTIRDENGNGTPVTPITMKSEIVEVKFPTIERLRVPVSTSISPRVSSVAAGKPILFDGTFKNESITGQDVVMPIVCIEFPIGMTPTMIDDSSSEMFQCAGVAGPDPIYSYERVDNPDGTFFYRATLKFTDPSNILAAGDTLYITMRMMTEPVPASQAHNLPATIYAGSLVTYPHTTTNPTGSSITNKLAEQPVGTNPDVTDENGDEVGVVSNGTTVSIVDSNELTIQKLVKGDDPSANFSTALVTVAPNGNFYYQIKVRNGSSGLNDKVQNMRIMDLLPSPADTYAYFNTGGSAMPRGTNVGAAPTLVSVTAESRAGATANIYYTDKLWATRSANDMDMMKDNGGAYQTNWGGWSQSMMHGASAFGVDIQFGNNPLGHNEEYTITVEMQAPGFSAADAEDFLNRFMYNSAAVSAMTVNPDAYRKNKSVESDRVAVKMVLPYGEIGNFAWLDDPQTGVQQGGGLDAPATNMDVKLYIYMKRGTVDTDEQLYETRTTTTDGYGYYYFPDLPCNAPKAGADPNSNDPNDFIGGVIYSYMVEFAGPGAQYSATLKGQGTPATDSDVTAEEKLDANGDPITVYVTDRVRLTAQYGTGGAVNGEVNHDLDAGFILASCIGDRVWLDMGPDTAYKNGLQEAGEPGVNGITVKLYRKTPTGDLVLHATTETRNMNVGYGAQDGLYLFKDLPMGTYVVEFDISNMVSKADDKPVYAFTTPKADDSGLSEFDSDARYPVNGNEWIQRTDEVSITRAAQEDLTWDAGLIVYSAVSGLIFEDQAFIDLNSLGIPLTGSTATLFESTGKTVSNASAATVQDAASATAVGDLVNINGMLYEHVDGPQAVDADGRYRFGGLEDGAYRVYFRLPQGYEGVVANVTEGLDYLDPSQYPDYNSHMSIDIGGDRFNSGYSEPLDINAGENIVDIYDQQRETTVYDNINAGGRIYSQIGDFVWYDTNANGLQDAGEPGIPDVVVTLQRRAYGDSEWDSTFKVQATTDANGYYMFDETAAIKGGYYADNVGYQYRVVFGLEPTQHPTITQAGTDPAIDSDAIAIYLADLGGYATDAFFVEYGAIDPTWDCGITDVTNAVGDFVWYDTNRNGLQDVGEPGVANIPVALEYNASGVIEDETGWTVVKTTETNGSGYYRFENVPAGYYRVKFQIAPPYTITIANAGTSAEYDSDASIAAADNWYLTQAFYMTEQTFDMTWDAGIIDGYGTGSRMLSTLFGSSSRIKTGDDTNIMPWIVLMIAAAGGIAVLLVIRRKKLYKGRAK